MVNWQSLLLFFTLNPRGHRGHLAANLMPPIAADPTVKIAIVQP